MDPKLIVELHTFWYPSDDQFLICLLFQRHHSGLYSFNLYFLRYAISITRTVRMQKIYVSSTEFSCGFLTRPFLYYP